MDSILAILTTALIIMNDTTHLQGDLHPCVCTCNTGGCNDTVISPYDCIATVYKGSGQYNVTLRENYTLTCLLFPTKHNDPIYSAKLHPDLIFACFFSPNSSNGMNGGELKGNCSTIRRVKNVGNHVGKEGPVNITYAKANWRHPPPLKLVKKQNVHVTDLCWLCGGTKSLSRLPSDWI